MTWNEIENERQHLKEVVGTKKKIELTSKETKQKSYGARFKYSRYAPRYKGRRQDTKQATVEAEHKIQNTEILV